MATASRYHGKLRYGSESEFNQILGLLRAKGYLVKSPEAGVSALRSTHEDLRVNHEERELVLGYNSYKDIRPIETELVDDATTGKLVGTATEPSWTGWIALPTRHQEVELRDWVTDRGNRHCLVKPV